MKIFIPTKGIFDGCMYYRVEPFVQLRYEIISDTIKSLVQRIKEGKFDPRQYDLFIMHSPMSLDEAHVFAFIKSFDKPIICDYDDLIWDMPLHWANQTMYYPAIFQASVDCLLNADYITVSTKRLKEEIIRRFNPDATIEVIENAVHPALIEGVEWNQPGEKVKVLWRGNDSKLGDLYQIRDAIKPYPNVDWIWFGCKPWFLHTSYGGTFDTINFRTAVPFESYLKSLTAMQYSYGLIALAAHPCNYCKSKCTFLENMIAGALTLAPAGFEELSIGSDFLIYSTDFDLSVKIEDIHSLHLESEFDVAKDIVLERYNLEDKNKQRVRVLEHVMSLSAVPGGI